MTDKKNQAFSEAVKSTQMRLIEEAKKEEHQNFFNQKRLRTQPFEMPSDAMTDFEIDFLHNEFSNIIFVDKYWDALSLLMRKEPSIFIQRPRRFGKSTFLRFLRFLCIYGLDYKDLKEKGQIRILIGEFMKINKPEHSEILKVLSDINERCDSEDCPNNILQKFDIFLTLNYKVILLIYEYESPILAKLSMFNDKSILDSDLKLYEKNYALFFSTLKSFCGQKIVSKIIMTGVISWDIFRCQQF